MEDQPETSVPYIPDLSDRVRSILEAPRGRGTRLFAFTHGGRRLSIGDATWVSRYLIPMQGEREAVLEEIRALSEEYGHIKKAIQRTEARYVPENIEHELELAYWRRIHFLDVAASDYLASGPDVTVEELNVLMERYRQDSAEARRPADLA